MIGHKWVLSRAGGIEIIVEELSIRMAALGHEVTCFNRGGSYGGGGSEQKLADYKVSN